MSFEKKRRYPESETTGRQYKNHIYISTIFQTFLLIPVKTVGNAPFYYVL